jgi:hypothetical protein
MGRGEDLRMSAKPAGYEDALRLIQLNYRLSSGRERIRRAEDRLRVSLDVVLADPDLVVVFAENLRDHP